MDTIETHRTFLFLDELDGSDRTPATQCRKAREIKPAGDVLPITIGDDGQVIYEFELVGVDGDVSEGGSEPPGRVSIQNIGRDPQLVVWDGSPGSFHRFEAMTFPDFKTKTMVSWQGQNFEAFSTSWENWNSPLIESGSKMTPVVDDCGTLVGYFQQGVTTKALFAMDDGSITYHFKWGSHLTGLNTVDNRDVYLTTMGQVRSWSQTNVVVGPEHYAQMYHERIPGGNKADVLTDIDGYIVALHTYLDPPPPAPPDFDLLGLILPTPPRDVCLPGGKEEGSDECALEMALFMLDMSFLFIDLLTLGTSAVARRAVMKGLRVASRIGKTMKGVKAAGETMIHGAQAAQKAGRLTLDVPKLAKATPKPPAAAAKKAKNVLAANASDKKSAFMHADLGKKTGMTHMAIRDIRYKMKKLGVRVRFRPAGTARKLRKRGAIPKWEELKMKTINDDDIALGAPKSGKTQPGYFDPKLPDPAIKNSDPERYKRLMKRYEQRKTEYKELAEKVKKYQKDGDIVVENGVVKDGPTGKDIAGDYDIYEILDKNGKRITPDNPKYAQIMKDLEGRRIQAQHGAHVDWNPTDAFEKKIKEDIIQRHRTSEPLYEFREDGSVWETFAE